MYASISLLGGDRISTHVNPGTEAGPFIVATLGDLQIYFADYGPACASQARMFARELLRAADEIDAQVAAHPDAETAGV